MNNLDQLYTALAVHLSNMMPEPWSQVYLYAELAEGYKVVRYYYVPKGLHVPVSNLEVIEKFNLDELTYETLERQLSDLIETLWREFTNSTQTSWSNFMLEFNSEGDFKVEYGYEDVLERDSLVAKLAWEYHHLGLLPKSDYTKKLLEDYLQNQTDKS